MREIRTSGSEGGGTGSSTSSSYPYPVARRTLSATNADVTCDGWDVRERTAHCGCLSTSLRWQPAIGV